MKTHLIMLTVAGMFLCTVTACSQQKHLTGNGRVVKKEIPIETFEGIKLIGAPATVIYRQSDKVECSVSGVESILEVLTVKVEGNSLVIITPNNISIKEKSELTVNVSSPLLTDVLITGPGDVILENPLKSEKDLSLLIVGTGDIKGKAGTCRNLKVQVNGTGDITFPNLKSESAKVIVSGTGDIQLPNLQCSSASVIVTGTGDLELPKLQSQSVKATVCGTGNIILDGQTVEAKYEVAGTGDIDAVGLKAANVSAAAVGQGDISCRATQKLRARTSGMGKISYKGNPKELDIPQPNIRKLD